MLKSSTRACAVDVTKGRRAARACDVDVTKGRQAARKRPESEGGAKISIKLENRIFDKYIL
jgi:hypothetical protein